MNKHNWIDALSLCQKQAQSYVLITVLEQSGSAPRNAGTKMLVTDDDVYDTIGGGNLEFQVMRNARELLNKKESGIFQENYPLSAKLGQCCGGAVTVLFEVQIKQRQHIALFGAGHVAQALIPILVQLPVHIHWFDEREEMPMQAPANNVSGYLTDSSADEIKYLPENTLVLVMTHNHQLDFDIVHAAVARPDIHFVGMIGSQTKAKRFTYRLRQREVSEDNIKKLICPVGNLDVPGKSPIEVAVSISAQIIAYRHQAIVHESATPAESQLC
ncbi:MAG: xanthine dehydrogenase accessory protein XdhC [Aestuariibacter sp.]